MKAVHRIVVGILNEHAGHVLHSEVYFVIDPDDNKSFAIVCECVNCQKIVGAMPISTEIAERIDKRLT